MSKETFYFPHDYNSIQDPKMMDLLSSTGISGIGMYWIIIEMLHQQGDGTITKKQFQQYIKFYCAFDSTRDEHLLNKIEQELINTGLLVEHGDLVLSERVLKNKNYREYISEKRSKAGLKSAEKRAVTTNVEHVSTNVEQNSTKERKGKERKEINTKVFIEPTLQDVINYFNENEYLGAERFYNAYSVNNWVDSHGNKIKNWKQKAQIVWFKPENKTQQQKSYSPHQPAPR